MIELTLPIPRINDDPSDFQKLAQLWEQVRNAGDGVQVHFDFTQCGFLRPNAVVFLGGLVRIINDRGGKARLDVSTMQQGVRANLEINGFAYAMGANLSPWKGNSIPYREDSFQDENGIVEYLKKNWLGRGWINISPNLMNAIASQMWEIYTNAFDHSGSGVGVLSCGQYFPKRRELVLAVADFGVGIPSNVRIHKEDPILSGKCAMQWAFTRGTSTAKKLGPRGMGLDLLKEFIRVSQGGLAIYSHDGYARITKDGEFYQDLPVFFEGTLVQVTLRCDDIYYSLSNEADPAPYF